MECYHIPQYCSATIVHMQVSKLCEFANRGLTTYYLRILSGVCVWVAVKVGQSVVLLNQAFLYADHANVLLAQGCSN